MKKNIILGALSLFSILVLAVGCGKSGEKPIKKLSSAFEKYDLPCQSGDVCDEVKNKIVQVSGYEASIKDKDYPEVDRLYSQIILTNNGEIYLYNDFTNRMVKLNGTTDITHIDGILDSFTNSYNPIIYQGENYYYIEEDGTIKKYDFGFDAKKIVYYSETLVPKAWAFDKDGILNMYLPCSEYKDEFDNSLCPNEYTWIKISPKDKSLNGKIKYMNNYSLVTEDGKLYNGRWITRYSEYDETLTYSLPSRYSIDDFLSLSDVRGVWEWNSSGNGLWSDILVQTNDKTIYYDENMHSVIFENKMRFTEKIEFNENIENVFFSEDAFLIIGESNVYIALKNENKSYDLTKLDYLREYKNDIKGFFMNIDIGYALSTDGNLYKIYENVEENYE